jgi:predicted metalloprotease with PDZ domain
MLSPADLSELATALGGLPILGCLENSPADRAGIRYGDILLSINGIPTASWSDFFQARRRATGQISVRVFRQGLEFDAKMDLPAATRSPREVLEELQRRDLLPRAADPALLRARVSKDKDATRSS